MLGLSDAALSWVVIHNRIDQPCSVVIGYLLKAIPVGFGFLSAGESLDLVHGFHHIEREIHSVRGLRIFNGVLHND